MTPTLAHIVGEAEGDNMFMDRTGRLGLLEHVPLDLVLVEMIALHLIAVPYRETRIVQTILNVRESDARRPLQVAVM